MQLCLLHLDDALESQPDFIRACEKVGAHQAHMREEGSQIRLWGSWENLESLRAVIAKQLPPVTDKPQLCFMGSGDFHHVTSFLIPHALENLPGFITVIHFDNHPDWVNFEKGTHCGSWVNRALEHPQVEKIITIGACSNDLRLPEWKGANLSLLSKGLLELYPYEYAPSRVRNDYGVNACFEKIDGKLRWKTIRTIGEQNFTDHLLSRIKTKSVYLTIDKDVLAREDAITNWDQGRMRLPYLLSLIKEIGRNHRIIGADVTGDYSTPAYSGDWWTKFSKHAEIFIDQPHRKPDLQQATNINCAANHALLEVLSEAMS